MKRKVDFDWYCKTKKDVINNAAYELIVALTAKSAPPRKFELSIPQWDDLMIANIVENAINAIDERIGYYCHPFYHEVDKLPCYLGDRCDNPHCIFKSDPDYRKAPSSVMDMDIEEMSKTVGKSSPQTGKWKSKEFRAFQGRKNHSTVNPAPAKGMEKTDQAERRSCLAER